MLKTTFKKAEDSPGFVLWKASNLLQRLHAECLKDLNVTPTQFSFMTCLVYLHSSGHAPDFKAEAVTSSSIVAFSGMDKMMVSDLVKALEKKKMLRRKANPEDARSFLIEPTALGEKTTNSAVQKIEALDHKFFSVLKNPAAFHDGLLALVRQEN